MRVLLTEATIETPAFRHVYTEQHGPLRIIKVFFDQFYAVLVKTMDTI